LTPNTEENKPMTSFRPNLLPALFAGAFVCAAPAANAISLIAQGSLSGQASDKSGLNYTLENGKQASSAGGLGSGLAWAGGNRFVSVQDRGPNVDPWNNSLDNTTSFISRFQSLTLSLAANAGPSPLPFSLTTTLTGTTLFSSSTPLNYGAGGAPAQNSAGKSYFTGRSDNFGAGNSLNPNNARFDPEAVRVSRDGKSVFVSDEYGPYVYQFDRFTGERLRSYALPATFGVANLGSAGANEISGNSVGRVANKGMEGLAISPDGKFLFGFMQSPLLQDGGDGGQANRIVKIDVATGAVSQYAYNNRIGSKNFNSSEIVALNDHEFLVLERDGKGLGDGSNAAVKQVWKVDLAGAEDVSGLSGQAALLAKAPSKTLFLDIKAALNAKGISDAMIPAKLEGLAFGDDVMVDGQLKHTLYLSNDNDFFGDVALPDNSKVRYDNQFFVFAFDASDLGGSLFVPQEIAPVPEPETYALMLAGLGDASGPAEPDPRRPLDEAGVPRAVLAYIRLNISSTRALTGVRSSADGRLPAAPGITRPSRQRVLRSTATPCACASISAASSSRCSVPLPVVATTTPCTPMPHSARTTAPPAPAWLTTISTRGQHDTSSASAAMPSATPSGQARKSRSRPSSTQPMTPASPELKASMR
jgi:hypothetical protein